MSRDLLERLLWTAGIVLVFVAAALLTGCTRMDNGLPVTEIQIARAEGDSLTMACAWGVTASGRITVGATAVRLTLHGDSLLMREVPGGAACVPTLRAAGLMVDSVPPTFPVDRWTSAETDTMRQGRRNGERIG